MAESTKSDDEQRTAEGGATSKHPANQRVAQIRGGLEKAVTGREAMIKAKAASFAEQLDQRTGGRHRQKIKIALTVVEFVVDRVGTPGADSGPRTDRKTDRADKGPEDLGEFHDVTGK